MYQVVIVGVRCLLVSLLFVYGIVAYVLRSQHTALRAKAKFLLELTYFRAVLDTSKLRDTRSDLLF